MTQRIGLEAPSVWRNSRNSQRERPAKKSVRDEVSVPVTGEDKALQARSFHIAKPRETDRLSPFLTAARGRAKPDFGAPICPNVSHAALKRLGVVIDHHQAQYQFLPKPISRSLIKRVAGDNSIGELPSKSGRDDDGIWPVVPVRDALEGFGNQKIAEGMAVRLHNQRGALWWCSCAGYPCVRGKVGVGALPCSVIVVALRNLLDEPPPGAIPPNTST
jgi:hypothetical protein